MPRSVFDQIAAGIVRTWFCPHVHRYDSHEGFIVHCFCLHCRESWTVPFYAYREPKGNSPMTTKARKTKGSRLRNIFTAAAIAVPLYGAFFAEPKEAMAIFALEPTQILNKILLGKQLAEQEVHTAELTMIDEQTMRSILAQPISTYGTTDQAARIASRALESMGMPYGSNAVSEHEDIFSVRPQAATSPEAVAETLARLQQEEDRAVMETVATAAAQRDAAETARKAVSQSVDLSQGSAGQTQALMAGNQINAATFEKLGAMETGMQAANYMQARERAAELAKERLSDLQKSYDTRDFITGPYPAAEGGVASSGTFVGM